ALPISFVVAKPVKVSWTWAHKRSIVQTTIADEIEDLKNQKRAPQETEKYIDLLLELANSKKSGLKTKIARAQDNAPRLLTNLVIHKRDENLKLLYNEARKPIYTRPQSAAGLPLFIPWENNPCLPVFGKIAPDQSKDESRLPRSDKEVETTPFIQSLRLYLYRED
ncbi:MAG: hypothetical protein QM500_17060, partial [Methylococcales bacterium]